MFSRFLAIAAALSALAIFVPASFAQDAVDPAAIVEAWMSSAHADATAEAFVHWDGDGEIPGVCAACHSGQGLRDFASGSMTSPGVIDHPVETGGLIDCVACHDPAVDALAEVTFPSSVKITGIESGAVCMTCHQGRESSESISSSVASLADDEVSADLAFINVHYKAAGATRLGGEVHGGFEYGGKTYMGSFIHVPTVTNCTDCHDPHSLKVEVSLCVACHQTEDPMTIRTSQTDFDGNGDTSEGISAEITRVHQALGEAIYAYSANTVAVPILYAHSYPYWFNDTNANGEADEGEAVFPNAFKSWTPRLLKAAYNYQFVEVDPGAYAHNPHYVLQIMYDSIEDLGSMDMAGLTRP